MTSLATDPFAIVIYVLTTLVLLLVFLKRQDAAGHYLLPLIALVPPFLSLMGAQDAGIITAYVMFGLLFLLEILRFIRPKFNRNLSTRWPNLFGGKHVGRPLTVSGAVTGVTLLMTLVIPETVFAAAAIGVVGLALAEAVESRWGFLPSLVWADTSQRFLLSMLIAVLFLAPALFFLTGFSFLALATAGLTVWLIALLPLPVDGYLILPIVAASVLFFFS